MKEYTMICFLKTGNNVKKRKAFYTTCEAINKKKAIKITNERFSYDKDYIGCKVYIDSERE